MAAEKPSVEAKNAHFLKGYASWLYCDNCNKTVAYLCYVTYRYFKFSFVCSCGCEGEVENFYSYDHSCVDLAEMSVGKLTIGAANKRFCCEKDGSSLFSPVPKNLKSYNAEIVCKVCDTLYKAGEVFEIG